MKELSVIELAYVYGAGEAPPAGSSWGDKNPDCPSGGSYDDHDQDGIKGFAHWLYDALKDAVTPG